MVTTVGSDPRRPSLPDADDRWLIRPRVIHLLEGRWTHRVVVLLGPAGYGKSTALVQAIGSNRHPRRRDIWIPCNEADSSASALVGGIELALGIGPLPAVPSADTAAIRESILAAAPDHLCLILDDVHHIAPDSGGATAIGELIRSMPENGHVLLAGRGEPSATAAGGETADVLRIGDAELLHTDDELEAIARQRGADLAALREAGGWPALTELAATSGPVAVEDRAWDTALANIDPDDRRILAALSIVGRFDTELAAEAIGQRVDLDVLLQRVPLVTHAGPTYALHPLLAEALARDLDPAMAAHARRAAARADAKRGRFESAVDHLIDGEMWDEVRELVVDGYSGGPLPIARHRAPVAFPPPARGGVDARDEPARRGHLRTP